MTHYTLHNWTISMFCSSNVSMNVMSKRIYVSILLSPLQPVKLLLFILCSLIFNNIIPKIFGATGVCSYILFHIFILFSSSSIHKHIVNIKWKGQPVVNWTVLALVYASTSSWHYYGQKMMCFLLLYLWCHPAYIFHIPTKTCNNKICV